jgi:hypothetical protein
MKARVVSLLSFAFAYSIALHGQQDDLRATLPELAHRLGPAPVYQSRTYDLILESLDSALPKADLVVHGTVERLNTYLSDDQKDLYTDYVIRPIRIMRQPTTPPQTRPGPRPAFGRIVVKRWGGQLMIDGVQVTQEDADVPSFYVGQEVVLLLAVDTADGKYRLPSPASGAFSVERSEIKPVVRNVTDHPIFQKLRGMTLEKFETEVQRFRQ